MKFPPAKFPTRKPFSARSRVLGSTLAIVALVAAAISLPPAVAQDRRGDGPRGPMAGQGRGAPQQMMPGAPIGRGEARALRRQKRWAARRMELLDVNHDGKLSADEIMGEQRRLFTAADVDGDAKLSADEFRRRGRWFVRLGTMTFFDMLDANGDGVITVDEITGPSARWFRRYDANKSGTLEGDELINSHQRAGSWQRGQR